MEKGLLSVISIKVFTQYNRNKFCFNKIGKIVLLVKLERTFVLIDIEKNFEKNMVEEICNQYKYIFLSKGKINLAVTFKDI